MPAVRFAVLTYGGDVPMRLLLRLALRGIVPEAVIVVSPRPGRAPTAQSRFRRALTSPPRVTLAAALRAAWLRVGGVAGAESRQASGWSGLARRVVHGGVINERAMLAALEEVAPDWLLLASVGILSSEALAIPKCGTLNAHHALLPWLRGNGVFDRALAHGIPNGVTVHLVDRGIDTGAIVRRRLVPVHDADTYASLHAKTLELGAELLADVADSLARDEPLESTPQTERHPNGTWATPDEIAAAKRAVESGEALRAYSEWRGRFRDA
jgi:methionyl-tRNA formyltransferase